MKEPRPLAEQMAQLSRVDTSNNATTDNSYMDASSLRNETCPAAILRSIEDPIAKGNFTFPKKNERTQNELKPLSSSEKEESVPFRKEVSSTYKISLCDAFGRGHCAYGPNCRFAHGKNELRIPRTAKTVRFHEELTNEFELPPKRVKPVKKLCRNFMTGNCRFGTKCHFSHQLMAKENVPKLMNTTIQPYVDQSFCEPMRPPPCETPAPQPPLAQPLFTPPVVPPQMFNPVWPDWYNPNPYAQPQPQQQQQQPQQFSEWQNPNLYAPPPSQHMPQQHMTLMMVSQPPPHLQYSYYQVIPQNGQFNQYQAPFNPNVPPMQSPYYPPPTPQNPL